MAQEKSGFGLVSFTGQPSKDMQRPKRSMEEIILLYCINSHRIIGLPNLLYEVRMTLIKKKDGINNLNNG